MRTARISRVTSQAVLPIQLKMATNGNSRPCLRDLEENDAESALIPTVPNAVPYQYEPRRPTAPVIAYETDSDVTSDSESEEDLNARVGNTEW